MNKIGARNPNKKEERERNSKHRVSFGVNMATKTFKSGMDYSREEGNRVCREYDPDDYWTDADESELEDALDRHVEWTGE